MKYLDEHNYRACLSKFFGTPEWQERRMAGKPPQVSGYYDTVRFFGRGAVDPRQVRVRYRDGRFDFSDPLIAGFATEMADSLAQEGRLYDGPPAARVAAADLESATPSLTVQASDYRHQAGSCFALDVTHEIWQDHGGTLREYYLGTQASHRIEDNPLALCLGVSGWLVVGSDDDLRLVVLRRAPHLASLEGGVGPSVAGSVDFNPGWTSLYDLLTDSLAQEVVEEIGLTVDEIRITPLAYAREIYRGERPQLFALIRSRIKPDDMITRLEAVTPERREFDRYELLSLDGFRLTPSLLGLINHEGLFNLLMCQEYASEARSDWVNW